MPNNYTLLAFPSSPAPQLLNQLVGDVTAALLSLSSWNVAAWTRGYLLVPLVLAAVALCLVMSVMMMVEKVSMSLVALFVKLFRRRYDKLYKYDLSDQDDLGDLEANIQSGDGRERADAMVLVQIPMYNEREVYQMSIAAACALSWPHHRLIIQILDDSTDPYVKKLVQDECGKWLEKGKNIKYETRDSRHGYKAGALKEGMKHHYVQQCEYLAIFDADFQPAPDFLLRTVPFLICNPEIALVHARWKFGNAHECLMTRIQEMSMDYHFKVEQESGSSSTAFFGFNGTAGVWRKIAIDEAGGWKERTTVEDMDLAVRASLLGWQFLYVGDVQASDISKRMICSCLMLWQMQILSLLRSKVNCLAHSRHTGISSIVGLVGLQTIQEDVYGHYACQGPYCVIMILEQIQRRNETSSNVHHATRKCPCGRNSMSSTTSS